MDLYTVRRGGEVVLMAVPDTDDEICRVKDFCRVGEPLKAELKKDPAYKHPHMEIRKEST